MKFLITCPFGLSSMLGNELKLFGFKPIDTFSTGTFCIGDIQTMYSINIKSRIANKVYLSLGEKKIITFDELFNFIYSLDFSKYIQNGQKISITVTTKNSKLTSIPSIQSISTKALIKKITNSDGLRREEDEKKTEFEVFVFIQNDICQVFVNTSGKSLHQRGYRTQTGEAPIKENVAAGLVLLSGRKFKEALSDPLCGSGTILIEAAMIAKNIAPGLNRVFAFQNFPYYNQELFEQIKLDCVAKVYKNKKYEIYGYDIESKVIDIAIQNAKNAGVYDTIKFFTKDFFEIEKLEGYMVSNPPYGKRLNDVDVKKIHNKIYNLLGSINLRGGIITSYDGFELLIKNNNRNKKIVFNGQEKCIFWTKK